MRGDVVSETTQPIPRDILDKLGARVHPSLLETDPKGNLYIGIDATLSRLNEVCCMEWEWKITHVEKLDGCPTTNSGKPQYGFACVGDLTIHGVTRSGSGSDINADPDTAMKASQAYALRKAGNYFNLARYLAKKTEREIIAHQLDYLNCDGGLGSLKKMAAIYFQQECPGYPLKPDHVAGFYGVTEAGLNDPGILYPVLCRCGFVF